MSSNGRTTASEAVYQGSNPCIPAMNDSHNDLCQACGERILSSCCCLLTDLISRALDIAGVEEFWITDVKYDYPKDSCIVEEVCFYSSMEE